MGKESPEAARTPFCKFAGLSRADLKNRMRAIDDAIDRYATGEWSASRFNVFLRCGPQGADD